MAAIPGTSTEDRGRWWGLWTLVAIVIVGFIVVESIHGLRHDTDPNKWGWGSALVVGLAGAFSLVRNLLGFGHSGTGEPSQERWWYSVLACALLFAAIATKALTSGRSVLEAFISGAVYFAFIGFGALGMYIYSRSE